MKKYAVGGHGLSLMEIRKYGRQVLDVRLILKYECCDLLMHVCVLVYICFLFQLCYLILLQNMCC